MKVIFTAIIGNYDTLKEPTIYTQGWNYICFTDNPNLNSDTWTIVNISDREDLKGLDPIRKARYIKTMFHKFIKEEYSIWADASMQINCNLDEFWSSFYCGQFSIMQHPERNCIYKEMVACLRLKKDDRKTMTTQMDKYWKLGFQMDMGLVASGLILRKRNKSTMQLCEDWFEEIRKHSTRDQLSFNFVTWYNEFSFSCIPFYTIGSHFLLYKHNV